MEAGSLRTTITTERMGKSKEHQHPYRKCTVSSGHYRPRIELRGYFFVIDGKRSILILNFFLDHDQTRTPSKHHDCDVPSHLPSYAFFLDAIKEIYGKDTSLSIYPKKIFTSLYAWPVLERPALHFL
jgi:hypothetical protein